MPDYSRKINYLSKVPESNSARQDLGSLQNPWRNAQLMQMNTQEREKQKAENYRQILENHYQFLTSFGKVDVDTNPTSNTYLYNKFIAYWDIRNDVKFFEDKGFWEKFGKLKKRFEIFCSSIFFHDYIDHLENGNEQNRQISDWLDWIAENKLNGYDQTDGEENELLLAETFRYVDFREENNGNFFKKQMIDLLPIEQKNKIMGILTKEFECEHEKRKFVKTELRKPENMTILKNMATLFCRTQVFRGILSLIHKPFNLKKLEFAALGWSIDTNKNPILKKLEKDLMEKVGRLNILMQKFPEKFDNYEIFLASFGKDFGLKSRDKNGEILSGEKLLDQMRDELTESYRQIMDDPMTEEVARKILKEKNKLEVN